MTTTEIQIEHAAELNDRLHAIDTALESSQQHEAPGHESIREGVERALPELRKNLKQIILNAVKENLEPGDRAALQELFSRVRKIVAEERGQIMAYLSKEAQFPTADKRKTELARARQMLLDLKSFERLAGEYEAAIFRMFVESESGIERVQF